jgi:hypothetical protein
MGKRGERPPKQPAANGEGPSRTTGRGKPFPVHEHVGRRLKEMFDEVTTQPIPDRFVKLLAELEQRQLEPTDPTPAKPKQKPPRSK